MTQLAKSGKEGLARKSSCFDGAQRSLILRGSLETMKKDTVRLVMVVVVISMLLSVATHVLAARPHEGAHLTVSVVANPLIEEVIEPYLNEFTESTGITVTMDPLPWASLYEKHILEITSRSGAYDVILLDDVWIEQYSQIGMLMPLNEFYDEEVYPQQFYPSLWELGVREGQQYVIPQRVNVYGMVYWKTPFEELGLSVPTTWDELLDTAEILTADGRHAMSLALHRDGSAPMTWLMLLMSGGGVLFGENWEPMLNSPQGVEALELIMELDKFAAPGSVSWRWAQARSALAEGLAVIHFGGLSVLAELNTAEGSRYPGEYEATGIPVPVGMGDDSESLLTTYAWAIPADTNNAQAAWEFINWVTGPDMEKRHGLSGSSRPVESAQYRYYEDPQIIEQRPLAAIISELLPSSSPQPRLTVWQQISDEIGVAVNEAVLGQKTPQRALDDANANVVKILQRAGVIPR